jgi:zinc transporter ZupT
LLLSLILSWLLVVFVSRRRIEEAKMRRGLIMWLSLGIGLLFGCSIIQLLPKAFGSQFQNYTTSAGEGVFVYNILSPGLVSLLLLIGFTFFMLVDLFSRHFIAKTHMSTTRVPGISHSPAESMRIEEAEGRRVSYIPAGTGPGTTVTTESHVVRAERVSTEPRSEAELEPGRRRFGLDWGRRGTILIIIREFLYTFFLGMTVGTVFSLYTNYNILAICISLCIATIPIQMVDTVLLYYSGLSWKKALMWNFLWNALMWGTVAMGRALGATGFNGICYLLAASVGAFLYFVLIHMFPAIVKGKKTDLKTMYLFDFFLGTYAIYGLRAIET